jgi:membrane associated rhomboid family serine protease
MLYDRPYMRERGEDQRTSPLTWLICAISAGFIIQMVLSNWFGQESAVMGQFAVTVHGLKTGKIWTLLTYGFLHSPPPYLLHIVCNLLALYFLGRELLPMLGAKRFLGLFAAAQLAGGLCWAAVNWQHAFMPPLYGATAGVDAMLVVFACFFPNREMTFALFFILPVRLKPKYVAGAIALFDLFGFAFYEVRGNLSPFGDFAHSAHLGGMLAGWLYYRFVHDSEWRLLSRQADIELPRWLKRSPRSAAAVSAPAYRVNLGNRADLRAEVDRILDKINSHGFGALTDEEKRVLDEARDLLSKR